MYSWIWRHLPFGLPGRLIGSLVLIGVLGAALWYGAFPIVDDHLPTNDGQLTNSGENPTTQNNASPRPRR